MTTSTSPPETVHDAWSVARGLARDGHVVDLHGIVAHSSAGPTIALTCAFGAIACIAGLMWPIASTAMLLAVVLSALADADGGHGWIRRFITKDIAHTVVVWPAEPERDDPCRPTLLVTAPISNSTSSPEPSTRWLLIPMLLSLVGSISIAGQQLWGPTPGIALAGALLVSGVVAWVMNAMSSSDASSNPAREVWESHLKRQEPPNRLRVVWALVGGGMAHHDGIQTLLLNHEHRLSREHTRVLCLTPSQESLSLMGREGWLRPRYADTWIAAIAKSMRLPAFDGSTFAVRALRLGWRAGAFCIASDQQHRGQNAIETVIAEGDASALDGRW